MSAWAGDVVLLGCGVPEEEGSRSRNHSSISLKLD